MAVTYDADRLGGALCVMMKTLPALALFAILGAPAIAQPGNLPFGNPLGDTHIVIPPAPAPNPFADRDAANARAQVLAAQRARQAALMESARPMPGASGGGNYVDYDRLGERQAQQNVDATPSRQGPVPTPFGNGITGALGGGIRPAWDRR